MKKSLSTRADLNRREFLVVGACTLVPVLTGCGGGSSSAGGASSGGAGTKAFTGTVTLPSGMSAASLKVESGTGESAIANGGFSVSGLSSFPTLATVLDTASSRVVLMGMLDPSRAAQVLDSSSCAAALLFVAVGGSQLPPTGRAPLLVAVLASPATAALAAVIKTQLSIDPFALQNGNAAIKAALATAVSSFKTPASKAVRASLVQTGTRAAATRAAQPAFYVDGDEQEGSFVAKFQVSGSSEPVIAVNNTLRETQLSVYYVGSADLTGARTDLSTASPILSSKEIPRASAVDDQGDLTFGQYPFTLDPHTTDGSKNADYFGFVRITPIFDSTDPAFFADSRYIGYVSVWRAVLADMYARAQAQVVSQFIIEALGLGCITDTTLIQQAVVNLDQIGATEHALLQTARTGTGLTSGTLQFLLNATSGDAAAQLYLNAVLGAFQLTIKKGGVSTLANLRGNVLIFKALGVLDTSILLGEFTASLNEKVDAFGHPVSAGFLNQAVYSFNSVVISPLTTQYVPGGPTINISIPTNYNDPAAYTLHWKLSGLNATISDNQGHSGSDFMTNVTTVTLTTTPSTAGTITVTCDVLLKPNNTVTGTATSTLTQTPVSQAGSMNFTAVQQAGIAPTIGAWTIYGGLLEYASQRPGGGNGFSLSLGFGKTVYGKYPGSATVQPGLFTYSSGNFAFGIATTTPGQSTFSVGSTINIPANGITVGELTNHNPIQMMITSVNGNQYGFSITGMLNNNFDPTFADDAAFALQASGVFTI